jgi:hypothetical protein
VIRDVSPWIAAALAAAMFGGLVASGTSWTPFVLTFILATLVFGAMGLKMRTEEDQAWLPRWIMLGFAAKVAGTLARYWMVVVLYGGGDSYRYFEVGNQLADVWQAGRVPELTESGAFGTQILEYITGILFAIFSPDMVGGFLIFSLLAYGGQLFFYAAFRHWAHPHQLKPYAFFVLFLPTYFFWPSSIGKDALVVFALGASAYCAARLLKTYDIRWIIGLALSLGLLGLIRIHVAGLVVIGLMAAGLLSRTPKEAGSAVRFRRVLTLGGFLAAGAVVLAVFPDIFGVDLTGSDALDSFTSDVTRRTSEKGAVAAGSPVSGPADVPGAIALALFRPFVFEASEVQHLFSAAETSLLLAVTVWKLPAILRSWRSWRGNAYVVFCTFYVLSYSIAFSVVRNLGIIARQRGQVIAFFLCMVIGLGWAERPKAERPTIYPTGVGVPRETLQSIARGPGP